MPDTLPRIAVFSYIIIDHAANQGRPIEDFVLGQNFLVSALPHFTLDRYVALLRQVDMHDRSDVKTLLNHMERIGWVKWLGEDEFRFLRPFHRVFSKCLEVAQSAPARWRNRSPQNPGRFLHLAGSGGLISTLLPGQRTARVFGVANTAFGRLRGMILRRPRSSRFTDRAGPGSSRRAPCPTPPGMFPKSLGGVQVSIGGSLRSRCCHVLQASRIDAVVRSSYQTQREAIQVTVNNAALPVFTASITQTDPQDFQNADGSAAAMATRTTPSTRPRIRRAARLDRFHLGHRDGRGRLHPGRPGGDGRPGVLVLLRGLRRQRFGGHPRGHLLRRRRARLGEGHDPDQFPGPAFGLAFRLGDGEGISGIVTLDVAPAAP